MADGFQEAIQTSLTMQQKSFDLPRDAKYARASLFPLKKKPVTLSALIWKTTPRFDFTFDMSYIS